MYIARSWRNAYAAVNVNVNAYHGWALNVYDAVASVCGFVITVASPVTTTMLLRASQSVARRASRAPAAIAAQTHRAFVQPSSSNFASVIDPPPPSVSDGEDLFRPRAGGRISHWGRVTCFSPSARHAGVHAGCNATWERGEGTSDIFGYAGK